MYDATTLYRGGVRFELRHFHVTLEEGGTTYKNDQTLYNTQTNTGNVSTPVLGQTLSLSNLLASYGIRGSSAYSKGLFTANPFSWLDLYGQFLYSQPDADVHYQESATGSLYLQSQVLFYTSQQTLINAAAKLPHTTGSFGAEIRPLKRLRILESWLTDRLHGASSAGIEPGSEHDACHSDRRSVSFFAGHQLQPAGDSASVRRQQEAYSARRISLRVGRRELDPSGGPADRFARRSPSPGGLGRRGLSSVAKAYVDRDAEVATSTGAYFRTSLYNYQKVRAQGRYQVMKSLNMAVDFTLLNNSESYAGHKLRREGESGKPLTVLGSRARASIGNCRGPTDILICGRISDTFRRRTLVRKSRSTPTIPTRPRPCSP